jgi:hypothetical protein
MEESAQAQLMVPDSLTPLQDYDGVHRENPETQAIKQLMVAVLADAVRCFQTPTPRAAPGAGCSAMPNGGFWSATVMGRSPSKRSARRSESSLIVSATDCINGACNNLVG